MTALAQNQTLAAGRVVAGQPQRRAGRVEPKARAGRRPEETLAASSSRASPGTVAAGRAPPESTPHTPPRREPSSHFYQP